MPKPLIIRKPLLIFPPMKWEFEVITKRHRDPVCQCCEKPIKVGKLRLVIVQGSGRANMVTKLCSSCGWEAVEALQQALATSLIVAAKNSLKGVRTSPRLAFREQVEKFLARVVKCHRCGQRINADPSGKMRNHKGEDGLPCKGSGRKVKTDGPQ